MLLLPTISAFPICSRPRNVKEVAHQEEVVHTLGKALETSNVGRLCAKLLLVLPVRSD